MADQRLRSPSRDERSAFLQELRDIRLACLGSWLVCGDFNMILNVADKNNGCLERAQMRRFRQTINDLLLDELFLHGRLFTWSNRRGEPMLERLDRAFGSTEWTQRFPAHHLRCLSSDHSDHAPLLLILSTNPWPPPRFSFEAIWTKFPGYNEVVAAGWGTS